MLLFRRSDATCTSWLRRRERSCRPSSSTASAWTMRHRRTVLRRLVLLQSRPSMHHHSFYMRAAGAGGSAYPGPHISVSPQPHSRRGARLGESGCAASLRDCPPDPLRAVIVLPGGCPRYISAPTSCVAGPAHLAGYPGRAGGRRHVQVAGPPRRTPLSNVAHRCHDVDRVVTHDLHLQ